ncbi:hypothetical protein FHS95_000644 [Sphingomonas naasensis]|nr:DUF1579 family protein [Sphingomonas naasensis]NIJ18975.1 hypothetical protein [Sphingomonas naasensis]
MRSSACLALSAALLLAAPLSAQEKAAVAPDREHRLLAALAGKWAVKQSFWLAPGKPPRRDEGTAELAMVLNGRHLRQNLHIADGTDFEGLSYLGYDSAAQRFFSTWMDVNFPGLVIAWGGLDDAAKTITLRGAIAAAQGQDPVPVREVLTLTDAEHFRYEFYETRGGAETLAVRLDYTRRR